MKILLANVDLEKRAGSEMWTVTMHRHLSKEHDVDVYTSTGINNLIKSQSNKNKEYDLALINHNVCLRELSGWNIKHRIFTSHGILPDLEQPIPGADVYVAVSEEVHANLTSKGFNSYIIRNPIDTEYFSPLPVNRKLERLLWMNNRAPNIKLVELASGGYEYRLQTWWSDGVKDAIQWADLVISSGRGIYEALSCGRNAMVVNWCGCDGMVTQQNIYDFRRCNCSGRFRELWLPPGLLRTEFELYDPDRNMRPYIIENNDVKKIAGEYLKL
jgi:hypothetical protein